MGVHMSEEKLCPAHSGLRESIRQHDLQIVDLWGAFNNIRNRPPVWATALMSFLTFIVGILVGVIGMGVK